MIAQGSIVIIYLTLNTVPFKSHHLFKSQVYFHSPQHIPVVSQQTIIAAKKRKEKKRKEKKRKEGEMDT